MTQLSRHALETLWEDGDFTLSRSTLADERVPVLVLAPASEQPAPGIIARLEHEYSLRDELDSDWAARPLTLVRREGRPALILGDRGGEPLNRFLGQPLELSQFKWFSGGFSAYSRERSTRSPCFLTIYNGWIERRSIFSSTWSRTRRCGTCC
jgi:hypothetical protein